MKESILHYIWLNKLFYADGLLTDDNENAFVIDPGKLNVDAGPDFFNAKIRIGETMWAGNIEIHTKSSDWFRHQHHLDEAYNNVILHVVKDMDTEVVSADGKRIPQLKLTYPHYIEKTYEELISSSKWIRCENKLAEIPPVYIRQWVDYLLAERLELKMKTILAYLEQVDNNWEEAFYITLARSFGFGVNNQAFEMLARSLPLNILAHHKNDQFQIEALLLGQAGLTHAREDVYTAKLDDEYRFLKKKYELDELNESIWKLLRLRPDNFPHLRLAQFAALIHGSSRLLSKIIDNPDIDYIMSLFSFEPSEYWSTHYKFGTSSPAKAKKLGQRSVEGILINTVVPFIFAYAVQRNNDELKKKAVRILDKIPAERNSIINQWKALDMKIENAFDSQAYLQLKKNYCDEKKCLHCRIGLKVLTKTNSENR